jgi:hypothetical protein
MPLPKIEVPKYELTIPSSGKQVKFRPFLVREEKILLIAMEAEDEKQMVGAVKDIITNCVYDEINVDEMPMFDIEYIFLQLRAKSKGEEIDLTFECEKCKTPIETKVDLSTINVTKTEGHDTKIQLTDEVGIIMRYPSLTVQEIITNQDNTDTENIFRTINHCIDSIWDKESVYPAKDHTEKELLEFIESLPDKAFEKLQQFFTTIPVLKHDIKLHCEAGKGKKKCNWKGTKTLEGLGSFFG